MVSVGVKHRVYLFNSGFTLEANSVSVSGVPHRWVFSAEKQQIYKRIMASTL